MTLTDMLGWFAAGLVFATFCAKQMAPLRALAIVSNLAFIGYGYVDHLWPIVVLHVAMLPMNVIRFRQALREVGASAQEKGGAGAPPDPVVVPNEFRVLRSLTRIANWRPRMVVIFDSPLPCNARKPEASTA